ncbi:serine-type D-Ala-D-Ala carboxypeptidase/endopeptidase (penicillin-binding protein 4) [Gammaproteobacteria bacterium]
MVLRIALLPLLFCPPVWAVLPPPVASALLIAGIPDHHVGLWLENLDTGQVLAEHQSTLPLNPASVMKLVTTMAALDHWGPDHRWQTRVFSAAPPRDGTPSQTLYLQGGGDPKLTWEDLKTLLGQARTLGVRDLPGGVVVDRRRFAESPFDPGAFDGDALAPYNAGPDALLVNFNAIEIRLAPKGPGAPVDVSLLPTLDNLTPVSHLLGTRGECGDWQVDLQLAPGKPGQPRRALLTGRYPIACGPRSWYRAPLPPRDYLAGLVRTLWKDLGGTLTGPILDGAVPAQAIPLASWTSRPLGELVSDINKFSNNVMARQLFLELATTPGPATSQRAEQVIRAWLKEQQIPAPECRIENGAGLFRSDRLSAQTLAQLLKMAWQKPWRAVLVDSLPVVGQDGTLKRRLKNQGIAGQAQLKTGTLADVKAIAGYARSASGRQYLLVFLIQDPEARQGRTAQDALLRWLYDNG